MFLELRVVVVCAAARTAKRLRQSLFFALAYGTEHVHLGDLLVGVFVPYRVRSARSTCAHALMSVDRPRADVLEKRRG